MLKEWSASKVRLEPETLPSTNALEVLTFKLPLPDTSARKVPERLTIPLSVTFTAPFAKSFSLMKPLITATPAPSLILSSPPLMSRDVPVIKLPVVSFAESPNALPLRTLIAPPVISTEPHAVSSNPSVGLSSEISTPNPLIIDGWLLRLIVPPEIFILAPASSAVNSPPVIVISPPEIFVIPSA